MPENPQDERDLSALGRALHALRIEHGLSAGELAARSHTTLERVHEIEAGEHDPSYDLLLALAQAIGVKPVALVNRAEELRSEDETEGR
ncbi:MAG TPA: helix-turn-helix transcriptional regulator [Solirubrobacteraceae bacterium]